MIDAGYTAVSPVFTVGGQISRDLGRDCVRLEVSEGVEGLRTLTSYFLAVSGAATGPPGPMLHMDGTTVDLGSQLRVSIGPEGGQRHVFEGRVSAVEALFLDGEPPVVAVHAEDALMGLRMRRRTRTYTRVTDGALARSIADDHGLDADVTTTGPTYDVVQQVNQSDLAFLRERARLVQAELWCMGRTLHFRPRREREGTRLTLVQGNQLSSVRLCADLAHQRGEVAVTGYDAGHKRGIDERAGPDVLAEEVTGGRTGPVLVGSALGRSVTLRVREAALSRDEARAWARAEMVRRGRRFVTASGSTHGSADMVVGSRLRLELVAPPFEGDGYYVTKVVHTFDRTSGFRTRFEAERSTLNEVA
jgi:phage protein D